MIKLDYSHFKRRSIKILDNPDLSIEEQIKGYFGEKKRELKFDKLSVEAKTPKK